MQRKSAIVHGETPTWAGREVKKVNDPSPVPFKIEATDYDRVKEVLQKRYNLTDDGYRQRFRTCSPEEGENSSMFIVPLMTGGSTTDK
ncbi:hypothetical protein RRG08_067265 [Elysia crispata]|uniref:Uncharacterized protein n=1 Tax=Elysia crispata TaxID=231223 RepID=A0AAE0XT55_9GAST|nr:hypothetical protein RRG08_067265 [Elysia crispata]